MWYNEDREGRPGVAPQKKKGKIVNKKFEVLEITRNSSIICVTVRGLSTGRKIEYLLDTSAFYSTDAELKAEFEASPKRAAMRYGAEIDLV